MARRILINARTPEELRIALLNDSTLEGFQLEVAEGGLLRGNIYRGIVSAVQPGLSAAFIDFGVERNGFLSLHDVLPNAFHHHPKDERRPRVEDVLEKGKPILVQVTKDPEGQKGAGLTTNISLAGRYLVLTPFDDTRGVSRKVEDDEMRQRLKEQISNLRVPDGAGFIVRTNAVDQTRASLNKDFNALMRLWKRIQTEVLKGSGAKLLYSDQDTIIRVLRDYLDTGVEEILVDHDDAFTKAHDYVQTFLARGKTKVVRYSERVPIFSKFKIEEQIDRIFERTVPLRSGGSIVIDRTEALIAIDVNSGKSMRGATQADTALNTNLEAAGEVARQLRLRDIGGLVVVDFIDMRTSKHDAQVEKALREAMKIDKARSTVGRISPNGLLEVNRQRIQQALNLRAHRACPTCQGTGRIASTEMVGLNLLRRIETRAASGLLQRVRVALHPEVADAFQNGRRQQIAGLEREFEIRIEVIASNRLHRPDEEIEWIDRERERETAEVGGAILEQKSLPPSSAALETSDGRTRSRKRKRRKRGGAHVPDDNDVQQIVWEHLESEPAEIQTIAVDEEVLSTIHEEGIASPARSRRRRRRKKNGRGHAHDAAGERQPSESAQDETEDHSSGESLVVASEGPPKSAARKRRRHRRRRKPAGADVANVTAEPVT